MRRTIAERLQKSAQEAPHITFDINVDVSAAEALRTRANARLRPGQARVSLTAVLAKALAWALERNPLLNAWLVSTSQGQEIHVLEQVNLGIAVALDAGLIVPVVPNASSKGILQLSDEINDRAERARSSKLRPEDVAEGTFTLSNLGMFGIDRFSAIINPPQVAILAVSRTSKQIVPDENDQPVVRPMMTLTLSADHRAVDGAGAARFMADLREALEQPESMTL
jgi:pyruvate dehydrogenase E2 component (dihydrolipoamide acetyltransferase)